MKVFLVEERDNQGNINGKFPFISTEGDVCDVPFGVQTIPETALQTRGRPFFAPDFAYPFTFKVGWAFRLSRMGRHIEPRFASRYYDAFALCASMRAKRWAEKLHRQGLPTEPAYAFDNALNLGSWLPLDQLGTTTLKMDDQVLATHEAPSPDEIALRLSYVSCFYKINQGDILLVCNGPEIQDNRPFEQINHIECTLGDETALAFRIK